MLSCLRCAALLQFLLLLCVAAEELNVHKVQISTFPRLGRLGASVEVQCVVECNKDSVGSGCAPDCGTDVTFWHARNPAAWKSMERIYHENSTRFKLLNVTERLNHQTCNGVNVVLQIEKLLLQDGGMYKCRRGLGDDSPIIHLTVYGELKVTSATVPIVHNTVSLLVNSRELTFNLTSIAEKAKVTINCSLVMSRYATSAEDDDEFLQQYTLAPSRNAALLQSGLLADEPTFFQWYRQNQSVALNNFLQPNVEISNWRTKNRLHSSLTFAPLRREDVGAYTCTVIFDVDNRLVSGLVDIFSVPLTNITVELNGKNVEPQSDFSGDGLKRLSESLTIRPFKDDNISLLCNVVAHPPAQVLWWWSQPGAIVGVESADNRWLHLGRLNFSHRAAYFCNATALHGHSMAGVRLRVRDPRAALWPLIGIGLEVIVILFVTIFFELC